MINSILRSLLTLCLILLWAPGGAQDLVIRNARILDGAGRIIDNGSIAIAQGRIASVADGPGPETSGLVIDAAGRTAMPGFIDTHRHVIGGEASPVDSEDALNRWLNEQAPVRMREFLGAGFTTVLSAGDPTAGIVELRRRLETGEIMGPRLLVAGNRIAPGTAAEIAACQRDAFCRANRSLIGPGNSPRDQVRALVEAGVDAVKIRLDPNDPTGVDAATAAVIAAEANRLGVPSIVHATAVDYMAAAVQAGITRLVHTPHTGVVRGTDAARIVVEAGVPMSSTLGVWVPLFGQDNELRWRNGAPFPPPGVARAGQGPVNARDLWDAGVAIAFGTDTGFHPRESLAHELRPLRLLFSAQDIVAMLGPNAAAWLELEDEIGTLTAGKIADVVIVDGDPLHDIEALMRVTTVIKGGRLVALSPR